MYVYIKSDSELWTTGFYKPNGDWEGDKDCTSAEEAANRVSFLNGGKNSNLNNGQKYMAALGVVLAQDYLKLSAKTQKDEYEIVACGILIVQKLDIEKEFDKASAETAEIGQIFKRARAQILAQK